MKTETGLEFLKHYNAASELGETTLPKCPVCEGRGYFFTADMGGESVIENECANCHPEFSNA